MTFVFVWEWTILISGLHAWAGKRSAIFAQVSNPRLRKNSRKLTQAQLKLKYLTFVFVWEWTSCDLILISGLHAWAGEESAIFAQASNPRLSKNSRKLTQALLELSLRWGASVLSEEQSRSGEKVSLKRELAEAHNAHCSSSCPGKNT